MLLPVESVIKALRREPVTPLPRGELFINGDTEQKKKLLSVLFPEGLTFEGGKYRTHPDNAFITLMISNLKDHNLLNKILLSHDAGWYRPGEENGGNFRGFTDLFEKLIPRLKEEQFSDAEIRQLIAVNPSKAFELKVRRSEN